MKAHFAGEPDRFSRMRALFTLPERKTWRQRLSDSLTCVVRRLSTDGDSREKPHRTVGLSGIWRRFRDAYAEARQQRSNHVVQGRPWF